MKMGLAGMRDSEAPRASTQPAYTEINANEACRSAAKTQKDHAGVPCRPVVVPEGKVETMEAMVDPAVDPSETMRAAHELARAGIEIEPSPVLIAELHSKNRQRQSTVLRVVVRIVIVQK